MATPIQDQPKTEIMTVFPNTGHQFFEFPLQSLLPKKSFSELVGIVEKYKGPYSPWSRRWPWIRWQFNNKDNIPVLKIAVETNLGAPTDGFLYRVEELYEKPAETPEPSLYACCDEFEVKKRFGSNGLLDLTSLQVPNGPEFTLPLKLRFKEMQGQEPVDVDFIVDLGNTRTAAVLLESRKKNDPISERIYPLQVVPRGTKIEIPPPRKSVSALDNAGSGTSDYSIIDSWLLLHRTLFADLEPPLCDKSPLKTTFSIFDSIPSEIAGQTKWRRSDYLPRSFIEVSPALIGGGKHLEGVSKTFARAPWLAGCRFYLSSPKRYAWDDEPVGYGGDTYWKQMPNEWEKDIPPDYYVDLKGLFRFFMEPSGVDYDIDRPPAKEDFRGVPAMDYPATFPKRDAICWFAFSLIEAAFRQINSENYLHSTGQPNLPRRLRFIRVTCPSGWTAEERKCYFAQWERAIKLFALTHLKEGNNGINHKPISAGGLRPELKKELLDEAVCSQLPVLYSLIRSVYNDATKWMELYGRGDDSGAHVIVMNLDIGGGTTDMAIIRYQNKPYPNDDGSQEVIDPSTQKLIPNTLYPKLLLRDGYDIAGDMLVKRIIEKVLVPAWIRASDEGQYQGLSGVKECLLRLFSDPTSNECRSIDRCVPEKMVRIVRLVFIPLVNLLLQRLAVFAEHTGSAWEVLDIKTGLEDEVIDPVTLGDLNDLCELAIRHSCAGGNWKSKPVFSDSARISIDPKELEGCVSEVFEQLFFRLGRLAGRFRCHLLMISGKPSELPQMRQLVLQTFPLPPQRVIQIKNFPAGDWYPFKAGDEGRIRDAKTCTVVGAALYQDICNGKLPDFRIKLDSANSFVNNSLWGVIPQAGREEEFYLPENLIFRPSDYSSAVPGENKNTMVAISQERPMRMGCFIGRQISNSPGVQPAQVYQLCWKNQGVHDESEEVLVQVRFKWICTKGDGDRLMLDSVSQISGYRQVALDEIQLRLNTLRGGDFWMDNPKLRLENLFARPQPARKTT